MMIAATFEDLKSLDTVNPWVEMPPVEEDALENRILRGLKRATSISGFEFKPEGPSDFQDGPAFMCAQEIDAFTVIGGIYFSKYGRLFTAGPIAGGSHISHDTWSKIVQVLSTDYMFAFAPTEILDQPYEGKLDKRYKCNTWWDRYFAPWYS